MEIIVERDQEVDRGSFFRSPHEVFILRAEIQFSAGERFLLEHHNLYNHCILDRTPPWYAGARAAAERDNVWPDHVPREAPKQWRLYVRDVFEQPVYTIKFATAHELTEFEPRMMAAFAAFGSFLKGYTGRPEIVRRRF